MEIESRTKPLELKERRDGLSEMVTRLGNCVKPIWGIKTNIYIYVQATKR